MPHGSLLGLLLFDLYTNDIFEVSSDANVVIYAGDTSIFLAARMRIIFYIFDMLP